MGVSPPVDGSSAPARSCEPGPARPVITVQVRQVDTHVHVIGPDEDRYPLNPSGVTGAWYRDDPCSVERLVDLMGPAAGDAAGLVPALSAYRFHNPDTLDAPAPSPPRCTLLSAVDPP